MNDEFLIIGGDNYNTLGMIRTLGEKGYPVRAIIVRSDFILASKSKYIKKLFLVDSIEDGYEIIKMVARNRSKSQDKIFLLVEGDAITEYLDGYYEELKEDFYYNQAKGNLGRYFDKGEQVKLAEKHGIQVMKTWITNVGEIPNDILYPVITKARNSRLAHWKDESQICHSEEELKRLFSRVKSPTIVLQQYVEKKNELCIDGFSIDGGKKQFVLGSSYTYLIPGKYSYYCTMFNYHEQDLIDKITEVMSDVGFEGIYSFEFLVDLEGNHRFLEINFRNSGWSYAATCAGMPLPLLWAQATKSGRIKPEWEKNIKEGYTFVDDFNDFKNRVLSGEMNFFQWMREYKKADCRLTLGRNDPVPMIFYLVSRISGKIKRKMKFL